MKINILTLFPEMFSVFDHSIIGKAKEKGLISIEATNIRDFTLNKHKKVDDYPYGLIVIFLASISISNTISNKTGISNSLGFLIQ